MAINNEEGVPQNPIPNTPDRDTHLDKMLKAKPGEKIILNDREQFEHEEEMAELMGSSNQPELIGKHTSGHGSAMIQEGRYTGTFPRFTKKN